jgi:8-oxo-dGTP pyrophosphatase MutT (NUDIX family)
MASAYTVFFHRGFNKSTYVLIGKKKTTCPNNGGQRAFPGGRANPGENLFDAARRETKEETLLEIPAWPDGHAGQACGTIMGHGFVRDGMHVYQDGYYVAYVQMATRAGLDELCRVANLNLPRIPANQREFEQFNVVSADEAMRAFRDDHDPRSSKRSTDWFMKALREILLESVP